MAEPKALSIQFADEINRFTIEIEGLATSFPTIMTVAEMMRRETKEQFQKIFGAERDKCKRRKRSQELYSDWGSINERGAASTQNAKCSTRLYTAAPKFSYINGEPV